MDDIGSRLDRLSSSVARQLSQVSQQRSAVPRLPLGVCIRSLPLAPACLSAVGAPIASTAQAPQQIAPVPLVAQVVALEL
jgi:hypothetical protein